MDPDTTVLHNDLGQKAPELFCLLEGLIKHRTCHLLKLINSLHAVRLAELESITIL